MKAAVFLALFALAWGAVPRVEEKSKMDKNEVIVKLERRQENSLGETYTYLEEKRGYCDGKAPSNAKKEADLESIDEAQLQLPGEGDCLSKLYILAFTSKKKYGGSDQSHMFELKVSGKTTRHTLYDRKGDDMLYNKGDLWKFNINGLCKRKCVMICDIQKVAIIAANNDGWNIESIVTMVKDINGEAKILTQDLDVNRWIDGNGARSHKRLDLTFA